MILTGGVSHGGGVVVDAEAIVVDGAGSHLHCLQCSDCPSWTDKPAGRSKQKQSRSKQMG